MGSPESLWDFTAIKGGVHSMNLAIGQVRQELDALRGKLDGLLANWEGDGDYSYAEAKQTWDIAERKLGEIATNMAIAVDRVSDNMYDADMNVGKTFRDFGVKA
ncbi:WXG100 family type VII secretion target [Micromonospora sp. NPDC003197]